MTFVFERANLDATAAALFAMPTYQRALASESETPRSTYPTPRTELDLRNWLQERCIGAYQRFVDPSVPPPTAALPAQPDPFAHNGFFCKVWGPVGAFVTPFHGQPDSRDMRREAQIQGPVPTHPDSFVQVAFYTLLRDEPKA